MSGRDDVPPTAGLRARFAAARARTDALLALVDEQTYGAQHDPEWSPIGWHRGHVAATEAHWILGRCAVREEAVSQRYGEIFNPVLTPKLARAERLPPRAEIEGFVREVRARVNDYLAGCDLEAPHPLLGDGRIVRFLIGHEEQHAEIMTYVLMLAGVLREDARTPREARVWSPREHGAVHFPAVRARIGTDDTLEAYDNERAAHVVPLEAFALDRCVASNAHYLAFIEDGGYRARALWSDEGWAFREREFMVGPRYWGPDPSSYAREVLEPEHPVQRLSCFEAEAYARWAGGRLPTELEWERAARWDDAAGAARLFPWGDSEPDDTRAVFDRGPRGSDRVDAAVEGAAPGGNLGMAGGVWEWTASAFRPYAGFAPWPYEGYSAPYFDGAHRVLRGGSWASGRTHLRASFRNWYPPATRAVFAGVRVARDGAAALR